MIEEKKKSIIDYLKRWGKVGVAFSGGVDSSLLSILAKEALGQEAHIFTIVTPYMGQAEIAAALRFAKLHQLNHQLVHIATPDAVKMNPKDRCYQCKTVLFSEVIKKAQTLGITYILDGSNADDSNDYRPGMQALKELEVKSPFLELGITKAEVRAISKNLNLETWDTPSNPCLLTRLPYDNKITEQAMRQVEEAEAYLHKAGFRTVRVRHQGDTARIEVSLEDRIRLLESPLCENLQEAFKAIGYTFVSVDLKGFKSGNMNQTL